MSASPIIAYNAMVRKNPNTGAKMANTMQISLDPEHRRSAIMEPEVAKADPIEIVNLDDDDDGDGGGGHGFYTPISDRGTTKQNAISVEQYSEGKDLNFAILASLQCTRNSHMQDNFIDLSRDSCLFDDDITVLDFMPETVCFGRQKRHFRDSVTEKGQSSNSKNDIDFVRSSKSRNDEFVCEICVEPKPAKESFSIKGCTHAYCTDCMVKYVASKLQENITNIGCPVLDCKGLLEPEFCRSILPQEVFDRWGNALCEAVILASQKFYCPFKDCSAMLIDDGGEVIRESECPNCRRLFCAQCKVAWHYGIKCEEFQKLNKNERQREDIMLMNLAQNNRWKRCPSCKIYVERTQGCPFMTCRCRTSFCYNCGTPTVSHHCRTCNLW